jgi:hypothetical protein
MLKRAWRWLLRTLGLARPEPRDGTPPKDNYPLW